MWRKSISISNSKYKFESDSEFDSVRVRVRVQLVFQLTLHCARASDPRVLITNDLLWLYTHIYIYLYTRTHNYRLVAAAIVGLFISVVSLSTCVTFRRNVFIMSAINQYARRYATPRAVELVCYQTSMWGLMCSQIV